MLEFKTRRLTKRVTRIYAFATELMYLVEGDHVAALLDTGSGLGSLRTCVKGLTDKPVIVLVTHGHTDHAMGAAEFDDVYMNHEDDYVYVQHAGEDFRRLCLDSLTNGIRFEEEDVIPAAPLTHFKDLKGGDSFNLGGVHIDIYACPGHTRGSLVMLIREERALLLGDACNPRTFVYDTYSTSIEEYAKSLRQLMVSTDGRYDTVYISHDTGDGCREMIREVLQVCEDIKAGDTDDTPFEFLGKKAWIAKAIGPDGRRTDGHEGNVVYSKDRVWSEREQTDQVHTAR